MSLADELLRDLEDLSEDDGDREGGLGAGSRNGDDYDDDKDGGGPSSLMADEDADADADADGDGDGDGDGEFRDATQDAAERDAEATRRDTLLAEISRASRVEQVASLSRSRRYRDVLAELGELSARPRGASEEEEAYQLTIRANDLVHEIDAETNIVHKYLRDHYHPRFPELEGLIMNALDYTRVVQALGNDLARAGTPAGAQALKQFLPPAQIMIITVTVTTSPGRALDAAELDAVQQACDLMLALHASRGRLVDFIESRMELIAPNLTAVVGSYVAAKLVGLTGGVGALSKTPSCNLISLGATRKSLAGFSIANVNVRDGVIGQSEFIQRTPAEFYKRAMRALAAKTILAARVDATRSNADGATGRALKEALDAKLQLWVTPPPNRHVKPLAIPNEGRKTKRGGRKARKFKEKFKMTELRKQQNKMAFGVAEEEIIAGDETIGLGMIGAENLGKVRAAAVDPRLKWKPKQPRGVSQKQQQQQQQQSSHRGHGSSTDVLGSATPYAFTPLQGIELVDPEAKRRKVEAANDKFFGTMTPFPGAKR